jgi:IS5 family transposase
MSSRAFRLGPWKRLGDKLELLLTESLRVAYKSGALRSKDLKRVAVDSTVQPKNITFPTDAKLLHAAIRLGRLIRDIGRKIAGQESVEAAFALPLARASQIRSQRQRGWKLYSFHAPVTGKSKASAPYEFGVKASIVTTNARAPGGQFVLHAKALPGNPYDGHTLRDVVEDTQKLIGCELEHGYVDKGLPRA